METLRLLYVEDDENQRKMLAERLRKKGFHVTAARSGETGIKFFKKRNFEAILCDLNMPGKGGEEVLETVRKKDKEIPFIVLSAHGTISQAVKTIKKGADHFIKKPANINEIKVTIQQTIEKKKLETKLANSQATLQMVAEGVPDIIYSLNTRGEFLSLSPAVKMSMGFRPEELVGTSVFNVIHPEDRTWVMKDFMHTMKSGGKEVRNLMFRMISKAGETRNFEVSRRLIIEAGRIVRIDGIARDDTERVKLQNKLEEYSQKLEKMVADRTESLKYANRQLSALNKVSNEFSKIFNEEELFDAVSKLLTQTLDFDRAYLLLARDKGLQIRSYCSGTRPRKLVENFITKIEKGIVKLPPHLNESFKKRKTIFVRDIKADRRWPKEPRFLVQARSVVVAPIKVKHTAIGVIVGSMDEHERGMNVQDVERFEMFANMVGLALDNIRAYQSMEQKVVERTESLKRLNKELEKKAAELEDSRIEIAYANVDLLAAQEILQEKNEEMEDVLRELSKKSKELQIVIDAATNAILLVDSSGTIQVINRRIQDFFGMEQNDVIGKSYREFIQNAKASFEAPDKFITIIKELEKNPDVSEQMDLHELFNRSVTLKAGSIVLAPTFIRLFDENEREIGGVWLYANITSIKQADQQVHAIVKASPIPTIISRIDNGEILYANEQLASLVRSTPDDLLGKSTLDFYYNVRDREIMLEVLRKDGSVKDFEVQIKRMDGSVIWVILSIAVTEIGGEKHILGGIYDISERKRFEEELEKERNFVSAILDTAGALVLVVDREGKIIRFNRACEENSGYSYSEVKDKPFWDIFVAPEELDKVKAFHEKLYAGQFPIKDETCWVKKNGEHRLIAWSNTCLLDGEGNVDYVVATGIDVTDQRQAEDNLKLFRELFINANDGIVIFNADGYFIEKNPAHGINTGLTDEDFRGRTWRELNTVGSEAIEAGMIEKDHFRGEIEMVKKDGTPITIDLSIFPIRKESGDTIGYAGIGRDMTERKKAEEAIANRLRYEEGLAALSQILLTRRDSEDALPEALGHLLEAAHASRVYIFENFEDETDGLCMRQIYEVCAPSVEPQIDNPDLQHIPYNAGPDRWRKMLAKGEPLKGLVRTFSDEEKAILEPQGILSMLCIPFKVEGKWYGFVGFDEVECEREWDDEDIRTLQTAAEIIGIYIERQKFEETLRISEERFRSLVENANDIIYSLTPQGEFSYLSPKVKDIMGYDVTELLGKPFFPFLHPDDLEESKKWFQFGFQDNEEHAHGYEFRMKHKDGSVRWFTTKASQILDENGKVMELIGVAHDITQMKAVLEEIERANRHLKETQAQLAHSEKMASLGTLVAGIAHEINTPMGAVYSMHDTLVRSIDKLKMLIETQLVKDDTDRSALDNTLAVIDDSNNVIRSGTERVTNIVRRLRSFARLDEAEMKTVDIHEGLEDTLTLIHHEIKHDITVIKDYGEIPPIACFPGQLNQVFLNILVNARQAIKGKGKIFITTRKENDKVLIGIKDTGSGISKEQLSKVFDPGFTTKGVGIGTGLGLAICYNIIQDHKGEITVESEVGKGTTFTVILPTNLGSILDNSQA